MLKALFLAVVLVLGLALVFSSLNNFFSLFDVFVNPFFSPLTESVKLVLGVVFLLVFVFAVK